MGRLYLIRHAQSRNNQNWTGSDFHPDREPDPDITERGHLQARALAAHLADPNGEPRQHPFLPASSSGYGLTHAFCSLMSRAILTAEYVAKACALELCAHPKVFEKYGIYEFDAARNRKGLAGPGRQYFVDRFPDLRLPDSLGEAGWWSRPAEDEAGFVDRMHDVVAEFKAWLEVSDARVALVAHGDFIDQFINELMGVSRHCGNYDQAWVANWAFHNTSISRVDFVSGAQHVVYLNRVDHLSPELISW